MARSLVTFLARQESNIAALSFTRMYTLLQTIDFSLQVSQEPACVGAVHLGVVELEGDGQIVPEQLLSISAPEEKGIVENTAVHANHAVQLRVGDGGSADDHAVFGQIMILTAFRHPGSMLQIRFSEALQIFPVQDIAGTDFSCSVFDDGVDGNGIVLDQLITYGEQVEFPDVRGSLSDAVIQEHIEFQLLFAAEPDQIGDIHGFEKGNHGIRRFHPEFEGHGSGGIFRVDCSGHDFLPSEKCINFCGCIHERRSCLCINNPERKE